MVKKYHNVFHIIEKDSGLLYFKDLELHTIELKKFTDNSNEVLSSIIAKVKTALDRWVVFLTRHDLFNQDNLPKELNDNIVKKALNVLNVLNVMNFNTAEREAYENHLKWLMVEINTIKKAKAYAKAEGKAEGRIEGELKKAKTMAAKMLKKNMPLKEIMEFTELSVKEI